MSTKVWAFNSELNRIQHISEVDKSYQGKMLCLDDGCKAELLICIGSKNQPYFAHKSNTSCSGGTKEAVLKLLCTQVLMECKVFTLPDEFFIFRKQRVLLSSERSIAISEVSPFSIIEDNFKTGIVLKDFEGNIYYIEFTSGSVSNARLKQYIANNCTVVAVDLSKFSGSLDEANFETIKDFILGSSTAKAYITSPSLECISNKIKGSLYRSNGDKVLCPARCYEVVVESKKCSSCPYFDRYDTVDKSVVCYGKGCYSSAQDFNEQLRLDIRKERYSSKLPKPLWGINKESYTAYFGRCTECHGKYVIGQGSKGESFIGIYLVSDKQDKYVYKVCEDCGHTELVLCPSCHKPMVLRRNRRDGSIFMGCTGYSGINYSRQYSCNTCISLFSDEPCCDNIHESIKAVGSLDLFLTDYDKAKAKLRAVNRKRKIKV